MIAQQAGDESYRLDLDFSWQARPRGILRSRMKQSQLTRLSLGSCCSHQHLLVPGAELRLARGHDRPHGSTGISDSAVCHHPRPAWLTAASDSIGNQTSSRVSQVPCPQGNLPAEIGNTPVPAYRTLFRRAQNARTKRATDSTPSVFQYYGYFVVDLYNHHRYHESLNNMTPEDVFFGRHQGILSRRERIKQRTLAKRRIANLRIGVV